jgi:hypothetical protein
MLFQLGDDLPKLAQDFAMVPVEVTGEAVTLKKPLDKSACHDEAEVIRSKRALDQLDVLLEVCHLRSHQLSLFASHTRRRLPCGRIDKVCRVGRR